MSICYFYAGAGNALLPTQMVVHLPEKAEQERLPYAARIFCALLLLCAGSMGLVGLGGLGSIAIALRFVPEAQFAFAVAAASTLFLLKDFFVRLAYSVRREQLALLVNVTIAATAGVILLAVRSAGIRLTTSSALMIFAFSQAGGCAAGLFLYGLPLRSVRWRPLVADAVECWTHGRWALGVVGINWVQTQAYAYVTLLSLGAAAVGRANAGRLLISPFLLLVTAVNQLVVPRLAELRITGSASMLRAGRWITAVSVAAGALYSAALLAGSDSIVPALLGPSYSQMFPLAFAWCVALLSMLLRDGMTNVLVASKRFRALTYANLGGAAAALGGVFILIRLLGAPGAIVGTAVGDVVLAILLWNAAVPDPVPAALAEPRA